MDTSIMNRAAIEEECERLFQAALDNTSFDHTDQAASLIVNMRIAMLETSPLNLGVDGHAFESAFNERLEMLSLTDFAILNNAFQSASYVDLRKHTQNMSADVYLSQQKLATDLSVLWGKQVQKIRTEIQQNVEEQQKKKLIDTIPRKPLAQA